MCLSSTTLFMADTLERAIIFPDACEDDVRISFDFYDGDRSNTLFGEEFDFFRNLFQSLFITTLIILFYFLDLSD